MPRNDGRTPEPTKPAKRRKMAAAALNREASLQQWKLRLRKDTYHV